MIYLVLAGLAVLVHLGFVAFVVGGGLLVRRFPRLLALHVVAVAWGAYVSLANEVCPLTPLENALLARAGAAGYEGGFLDHYLVPLLYPGVLTPRTQKLLGAGVVVLNLGAYAWVRAGWKKRGALVEKP